mmetsp:Transcript_10309/g.917  ORF Transcript_10309/g.917 Transcript_10309/m.917 type:complete len:84 (+) Transcript_10309:119-370(+)
MAEMHHLTHTVNNNSLMGNNNNLMDNLMGNLNKLDMDNLCNQAIIRIHMDNQDIVNNNLGIVNNNLGMVVDMINILIWQLIQF